MITVIMVTGYLWCGVYHDHPSSMYKAKVSINETVVASLVLSYRNDILHVHHDLS